MRTYFYISIIFLLHLSAIYPQAGWRVIETPADVNLKRIFFVDSLYGWAAGDSGVVIRTTDSGETWHLQNTGVDFFIFDVFFLNRNLGWALTWQIVEPFGTIILKTTNGGTDWSSELYPQQYVFMNAIYFTDSLTGFMGGMPLVKTTNGGLSWYEVHIDSGQVSDLPILRFNFYDENFGFANGGFLDVAGVIWRTTDNGENWASEGISPDPINDIVILSENIIVTLSGDPEGFFGMGVIRSTNSGLTWLYNETTISGLAYGMDFATPLEGWAAAANRFLFTSDGGLTWSPTPSETFYNVFDVVFVNTVTGFASGDGGRILKYIPDITSFDDKQGNTQAFTLHQNYPNPFNPKTNIKYTIPPLAAGYRFSKILLKIYNVLGKEVATLVEDYKPAGEYEITFDASELASGVYFYRLEVENFIETKKMVLLR